MQSAYDLSERMRSNIVGVKAANYSYLTAYDTTIKTTISIPTCTAPCSAAQISNIDINEWLYDLQKKLLDGAGNIFASGDGFKVVVMWKEPGFSGIDPACPAEIPAPGAGVRCYLVNFSA